VARRCDGRRGIEPWSTLKEWLPSRTLPLAILHVRIDEVRFCGIGWFARRVAFRPSQTALGAESVLHAITAAMSCDDRHALHPSPRSSTNEVAAVKGYGCR
jgi:hypothetical protein